MMGGVISLTFPIFKVFCVLFIIILSSLIVVCLAIKNIGCSSSIIYILSVLNLTSTYLTETPGIFVLLICLPLWFGLINVIHLITILNTYPSLSSTGTLPTLGGSWWVSCHYSRCIPLRFPLIWDEVFKI